MAFGQSDTSLQELLAAGLLRAGEPLIFRSTGKRGVINADATITVNGQTYASPTQSANSLAPTNTNGWVAWRVERSGSTVTLDSLRKSFRSRQAPLIILTHLKASS